MARLKVLPALTLLASCSYSLEGDLTSVRADIVELRRRIPPEAPLWISEGPDRFDPFVEDTSDHVPDFIYHHVLRKLYALKVEEADAQSQGDFDAEACAKDPSSFRGKFWRVHGVIGEVHTEAIKDPQCPVRAVHAGVFLDAGMRPVIFHVVQKPDVLTLGREADSVETKALFVKMIEYTSRSGRRVVAPFFIGKALRRFL